VLQKFSTARPSSSVAKHKLLRDTKKQQDVITSNRVVMTHFNSKDHSIDDFRYAGIEISRNTIYRQTRESLFIKMCNTQQEGINKRK
jgi:hypothetical protein